MMENIITNPINWDFQGLVEKFISMCWHQAPAAIARAVLHPRLTELNTPVTGTGEGVVLVA